MRWTSVLSWDLAQHSVSHLIHFSGRPELTKSRVFFFGVGLFSVRGEASAVCTMRFRTERHFDTLLDQLSGGEDSAAAESWFGIGKRETTPPQPQQVHRTDLQMPDCD